MVDDQTVVPAVIFPFDSQITHLVIDEEGISLGPQHIKIDNDDLLIAIDHQMACLVSME